MGIFDIFKRKSKNNEVNNSSEYEIIRSAILLLENNSNFKSEAELINKINELTSNFSLAWELYCLIPAAYTRLVVKEVTYSNEVIINTAKGKQVKKQLSDFKIYRSIQSVVQQKIIEGKNAKIEMILFLSSEFNAIHNAILSGSKMENLVLSPMMMFAPDNYVFE